MDAASLENDHWKATTMTNATREPTKVPRKAMAAHESADGPTLGGTKTNAAVNTTGASAVAETCLPAHEGAPPLMVADAKARPQRTVARGLTTRLSTKQLKDGIWLRALLTANRFRVIRTIDVAVACFPERPLKAALTAAQRAMRGIVKADLLRRYRTDRFQTVYGLTQKGVDWLDEAGFDAASSVRRVSDMTNPEHRLWAQFWVLCCEARGLRALTEQELLQELNKALKPGAKPVQGLLTVSIAVGDRIRKRAVAVVQRLADANNTEVLAAGRRHFREVESGTYAVWTAPESRLKDGRTRLVDTLQGHVIIELLPTWLPKVRIDAKNAFSTAGWFGENYLPYRRPASMPAWPTCSSPLIALGAAPQI